MTSIEKIVNIQINSSAVIIDGRSISFDWKDYIYGTSLNENQQLALTRPDLRVAGANKGTFTGYAKSNNALQVFLYNMGYTHWTGSSLIMYWWWADGTGIYFCSWAPCIPLKYIDVIVDIDTFRVIDTSLNVRYRIGSYKYNFVASSKVF